MGVYTPRDYIICLALLAVILYILHRVFMRVRLDKEFIYAIWPYMLVGIFIQLLADAGLYTQDPRWSTTPGVYLTAILAASIFLAAGFILKKISGIPYWITPMIAGITLSGLLLVNLAPYIIKTELICYTIISTIAVTLIVHLLDSLSRLKIYSRNPSWKINTIILSAHMLDAMSTFIAFNFYGFQEEHALPALLFDLAGGNALVMLPVKILIVTLTLYYLERWRLEEKQKRNTGTNTETLYAMVKLLIFILGIGPGLRNTLLMSLGT